MGASSGIFPSQTDINEFNALNNTNMPIVGRTIAVDRETKSVERYGGHPLS